MDKVGGTLKSIIANLMEHLGVTQLETNENELPTVVGKNYDLATINFSGQDIQIPIGKLAKVRRDATVTTATTDGLTTYRLFTTGCNVGYDRAVDRDDGKNGFRP